MRRPAFLVGFLSAALLVALATGSRAQNRGDQCPLSQVGNPCSGAGTCLEFSCDFESPAGSSKTASLAFCEGMPNLCPPGSKYMGPCGRAGRCSAVQTVLSGPTADGGSMTCQTGFLVCFDLPAGALPIPIDAGPSFDVDGGARSLGARSGAGRDAGVHGSVGDAGASADMAGIAISTPSSGGCSISLGRAPRLPGTIVSWLSAGVALLRRRRSRRPLLSS